MPGFLLALPILKCSLSSLNKLRPKSPPLLRHWNIKNLRRYQKVRHPRRITSQHHQLPYISNINPGAPLHSFKRNPGASYVFRKKYILSPYLPLAAVLMDDLLKLSKTTIVLQMSFLLDARMKFHCAFRTFQLAWPVSVCHYSSISKEDSFSVIEHTTIEIRYHAYLYRLFVADMRHNVIWGTPWHDDVKLKANYSATIVKIRGAILTATTPAEKDPYSVSKLYKNLRLKLPMYVPPREVSPGIKDKTILCMSKSKRGCRIAGLTEYYKR